MNPLFRKILFRCLALFFVIFVPILVFAVLGFDFNFDKKTIINSLDVTIETLPRNANISNFGQNLDFKTPLSLKIEAGNSLDLVISHENFLTERFAFVGPKDQNTTIRLSNLRLLPTTVQTSINLQEPVKNQASGSPLRENLTILPQIILWTTKNQVKQIKTQNNISNNPSQNSNNNQISNLSSNSTSVLFPISIPDSISSSQTNSQTSFSNASILDTNNSNFLGSFSNDLQNQLTNSPSNSNPNLDKTENNSANWQTSEQSKEAKGETEQIIWMQNFNSNGLSNSRKVFKTSKRDFKALGNWQNIGKSYWNQSTNWLLFVQNNDWNLVDLEDLPPIKNLIQNSDWQFLVLDKSGSLWLWDLQGKLDQNLQKIQPEINSQSNLNNLQNSKNINNFNSQINPQNSFFNSFFGNNSDNSISLSSSSGNSQNNSPANLQNNLTNNSQTSLQEGLQNDVQNIFQWQFLESSVCQMSFLDSSNTIWLLQNSRIFRLEISKIENWDLGRNFFAENNEFNAANCNKIEVKSFLQGYVFLINRTLWFLPDGNRGDWLILANFVDSFETFEESLFWQSGKNLYHYSSITKLEKYLGQIELENTKMFYDFNWRRLMIYGQITGDPKNPNQDEKTTNSVNSNTDYSDQVWSVWFDKLNPSSQNIIFYPKMWLQNQNCLNRIQDQLQFCLQDENLVTYGNFNLF